MDVRKSKYKQFTSPLPICCNKVWAQIHATIKQINHPNCNLCNNDVDTDQRSLAPRLKGQHDSFLYWPAQVKEILKAKRVWHFVRQSKAAASSYASNQKGVEKKDTATGGVKDDEYARNAACLVILHALCKVLFTCVLAHQDDP